MISSADELAPIIRDNGPTRIIIGDTEIAPNTIATSIPREPQQLLNIAQRMLQDHLATHPGMLPFTNLQKPAESAITRSLRRAIGRAAVGAIFVPGFDRAWRIDDNCAINYQGAWTTNDIIDTLGMPHYLRDYFDTGGYIVDGPRDADRLGMPDDIDSVYWRVFFREIGERYWIPEALLRDPEDD